MIRLTGDADGVASMSGFSGNSSRVLAHVAGSAKSLREPVIHRETFDATNAAHRSAFYEFKHTGRWSKHFNSEYPFTNVVDTINNKLLDYLETIDQ